MKPPVSMSQSRRLSRTLTDDQKYELIETQQREIIRLRTIVRSVNDAERLGIQNYCGDDPGMKPDQQGEFIKFQKDWVL